MKKCMLAIIALISFSCAFSQVVKPGPKSSNVSKDSLLTLKGKVVTDTIRVIYAYPVQDGDDLQLKLGKGYQLENRWVLNENSYMPYGQPILLDQKFQPVNIEILKNLYDVKRFNWR